MRKFLLIDDHLVIRSGLKECLSQIYKPCEVHEADNAEGTIEKLKLYKYDLLIMDVQIPGSDMLKLVEYVCIKYPGSKVLMFSISAENIFAKRFLKQGAKGFLPKDSSMDEIEKAVNIVLNGGKYISPSFAADSVTGETANPFDSLTSREFEIIRLLLAGESSGSIGDMIHLQSSTIGTHKARAFEKLEITNIIELKALAALYNF